jgi:hypothetical protein
MYPRVRNAALKGGDIGKRVVRKTWNPRGMVYRKS